VYFEKPLRQTGALSTNTHGIPQFGTCSMPLERLVSYGYFGLLFIKVAGLGFFLWKQDSHRHFTSFAAPPNTTLKGK
jgi:hypothetical protein